mmetsp:Transcript_42278/g.99926  ORF Transcript_42278/g.99926 Transcript_42278/m.99926 type:complete len:709 (-) Transcript_42278:314-2440(-)|eukprot:CAMPEP_0177714076 /NCGR_PEP_ID=MMETSP0484_2-20121128/13273_1 /TAXON_ID=354590 /ORGANISM="Rhodomonas lens, Strain RHODO" /LENGTH=708 /DNA_ID=CAMNT_0019225995 /DNA_START=159 /DNA_END=2285 /DNA_ORIENTATION=-
MNPSVIGADVDACFAHFARRMGDLALQSDANRTRVLTLGGVELLVNLLEKAGDDAVIEGAAVALSNLALAEQGRAAVIAAGGMPPLVRILSSSEMRDAAHAAAAGALRNLACGAAGRENIISLGGVELLVKHCGGKSSPGVEENAAAAIANLADDPVCRERVSSCGGLEVLVSLLNSSQTDSVVACAAAALGNLADDDQNRVTIAKVGGLEPLVRLCASSINDAVLESSAAALANLAYNDDNRKRIAQLTGIEPLVWLCAHSKNEAVLESAAAALGNLAYYNDLNRIKVAETGGLQALVSLCEEWTSEPVLEAACGALRHVVYNNDSNRMKFVKMGGLDLLVNLCATCDNEAVLESATAMLRKAVSNADVAHRLLDAGALPALLKLESEWIGTVKSYATQALRSLEKHSRRPWVPPSGALSSPSMAYMLLPCAHPASMTPAIQKQMVMRSSTGVANGASSSAEALNKEMDAVHQDLEAVERWLRARAGTKIVEDRCIEAGDAGIVLQNAGAQKAIREFFHSEEVDLFVLVYSGHATAAGGWCFAEHVVTFDQVLGMWQQARAKTANTQARLLLIVDAPYAGAWTQALAKVPAAAAFASGIAVQAGCAHDQRAWSEPGQGGDFIRWYTEQKAHGHSPWTIGEHGAEPPLRGQQTPCMSCKFDLFSDRRALLCIGGEEHVPAISLFGTSWFAPEPSANGNDNGSNGSNGA